MLAQSLMGRCRVFRDNLDLDLRLVRIMAGNAASIRPEDSFIAVINAAVKQVEEERANIQPGQEDACMASGYSKFRAWAARSRGEGQCTSREDEPAKVTPFTIQGDPLDLHSIFGEFGWSPLNTSPSATVKSGDTDLNWSCGYGAWLNGESQHIFGKAAHALRV